jgi:hypothetical protein
MRLSASAALLSAALLTAAPLILTAQAAGTTAAATAAPTAAATAPAAPATAAATPPALQAAPVPKAPGLWILGLARFSAAESEVKETILLSTLPRLIAAKLQSLPSRRTPEAEATEAGILSALRARFAAGTELATKLDARDLGFLDPTLYGEARKVGIATAEKGVLDSAKRLDAALKEAEPSKAAPVDLAAKLWEGHAKGQLVDLPSPDLPKAAKAAGVDLLVTGSVALDSGYAIVVVRGFDASLGREVFSWKSFCAVDDPEPLAMDMAIRLERWSAGRDFARLELRPDPPTAELRVNGELLSGSSRVAYVYREGPVDIVASASGYAPRVARVDLALGERKSLELKLEPLATGVLSLSTDPSGASVSLDSLPLGKSPLSIDLDGSRAIVSAAAEGRETQTVVLPASGDSSMELKLLPSDGIGPSGRISAAKDNFYSALGLFVLCVPATALTIGVYHGYDEAYLRSGSPTMLSSRGDAAIALAVAGTATATSAVFMIIRLVKYLKTAH